MYTYTTDVTYTDPQQLKGVPNASATSLVHFSFQHLQLSGKKPNKRRPYL